MSLGEDPGLIHGVYGVYGHTEARAHAIARDAWQGQILAAEAAGIQRTTVALCDGAVVGYAVLALLPTRPDVASHNGTFVHPDFKRLGVARALKAEQIAWARAAGFTRLEASSDPGNVAKMRLYARLGYRKTPGWYVMRASRVIFQAAPQSSPSSWRTPSSSVALTPAAGKSSGMSLTGASSSAHTCRSTSSASTPSLSCAP